jgi:hypothetical protein
MWVHFLIAKQAVLSLQRKSAESCAAYPCATTCKGMTGKNREECCICHLLLMFYEQNEQVILARPLAAQNEPALTTASSRGFLTEHFIIACLNLTVNF